MVACGDILQCEYRKDTFNAVIGYGPRRMRVCDHELNLIFILYAADWGGLILWIFFCINMGRIFNYLIKYLDAFNHQEVALFFHWLVMKTSFFKKLPLSEKWLKNNSFILTSKHHRKTLLFPCSPNIKCKISSSHSITTLFLCNDWKSQPICESLTAALHCHP